MGNLKNTIIRNYTVAVIGYGNQGHAHALNLRNSGVHVVVSSRDGKGAETAQGDGFKVVSIEEAVQTAQVLMWLLPDQVIPTIYPRYHEQFTEKHFIGFGHSFAYHFNFIPKSDRLKYFVVAPKGAGVILRQEYLKGLGLPGAYALSDPQNESFRSLCQSYAEAIGCTKLLIETTFQEEVETDLFGEQVVLCGGLVDLMKNAFEVLVENGHQPEMAFLETCYEAKLIIELLLKQGPAGFPERISPTAFYGGRVQGPRIITPETRQVMEAIFQEVRTGKFAEQWMNEVKADYPTVKREKEKLASSLWQRVFLRIREYL